MNSVEITILMILGILNITGFSAKLKRVYAKSHSTPYGRDCLWSPNILSFSSIATEVSAEHMATQLNTLNVFSFKNNFEI